MQKNYLRKIASLSCLSLSQMLSLALLFHPSPSQAQPKLASEIAKATQRLNQMFSADIQKTLNACSEQGMVNIAAGADQDGSVICTNGFRNSAVQFTDYMNTISDFMAAGFLAGFRTAYKANNSLKPPQKAQMLALFASPAGTKFVQQLLEQQLGESQLIAKDSPQSLSFLTNSIVQRSLPTLTNQDSLENLLGTPNQYNLVVDNF